MGNSRISLPSILLHPFLSFLFPSCLILSFLSSCPPLPPVSEKWKKLWWKLLIVKISHSVVDSGHRVHRSLFKKFYFLILFLLDKYLVVYIYGVQHEGWLGKRDMLDKLWSTTSMLSVGRQLTMGLSHFCLFYRETCCYMRCPSPNGISRMLYDEQPLKIEMVSFPGAKDGFIYWVLRACFSLGKDQADPSSIRTSSGSQAWVPLP
jgi:hypothetical protein